MAAAGKNLKDLYELGGSDSFIILEDADIDKAIEMAIIGRMNNNGQSCCRPSKDSVEAIADEF
jgi:succinate-semialdehyde dehydrogenase/glutarate-semialdehyde dehydrogenase